MSTDLFDMFKDSFINKDPYYIGFHSTIHTNVPENGVHKVAGGVLEKYYNANIESNSKELLQFHLSYESCRDTTYENYLWTALVRSNWPQPCQAVLQPYLQLVCDTFASDGTLLLVSPDITISEMFRLLRNNFGNISVNELPLRCLGMRVSDRPGTRTFDVNIYEFKDWMPF